MSEKLTIWKTSAVGVSTGVSLRCNDCGVTLLNMEAPDGITGGATVFCPRCQKTTLATAFVFCTGEREPLKVKDGERRFMVKLPNAELKGGASAPSALSAVLGAGD